MSRTRLQKIFFIATLAILVGVVVLRLYNIRYFGPVPTIIVPFVFIAIGGIVTAPDKRTMWRIAIVQSILIAVTWLAIKYL